MKAEPEDGQKGVVKVRVRAEMLETTAEERHPSKRRVRVSTRLLDREAEIEDKETAEEEEKVKAQRSKPRAKRGNKKTSAKANEDIDEALDKPSRQSSRKKGQRP